MTECHRKKYRTRRRKKANLARVPVTTIIIKKTSPDAVTRTTTMADDR
jgi:hypothetical protein